MNIIKNYLTSKAFEWSDAEKENKNSVAGYILRHIESTGKLRDAQAEALKVYLWLKCVANNKPLVEVFKQNYSDTEGDSLTTLLVHIAGELENKKLEKFAKTATTKELEGFFVDLFGGYNHISNVLLSLPMGAGKTFVMASMIYIDLYFNLNNSDDRFAKNFLIFAPSGLKSSVVPSLRSIERFDPTWILPADVAQQIKKHIKFVVLDVAKTAKKSNRIENPNARKVQECLNQADPSGYVFVTNAEKVILDKVREDDPYQGMMFEKTQDEKSIQANELRHTLAKVPNLSILIDEVHHIQKEENKLKFVINNLFNQGNTINIIGFTGTPYFKRKLTAGSLTLTLDQIPSTVYHYELKNGVRNFLKQPVIKSFSSNTETIVKSALEDFFTKFYEKTYKDGRKPKLAIYCSNIERLEEEVMPIVLSFYAEKGLDSTEVFKYYGKSTTTYTLDKDSDLEFGKLDTPYSNKRVILLVQIAKEGWDCQSLTGVVLSGEGDSPKNMVLQTSCRCLREVDDAQTETGLIYLNQANYRHLEKELGDNHNITIKEFETGKEEEPTLLRVDRRKYLKLPPLEYKQLLLEYEVLNDVVEVNPEPALTRLISILKAKESPYFVPEISSTRSGLDLDDESSVSHSPLDYAYQKLSFSEFLNLIFKSSFSGVTYSQLHQYRKSLFDVYGLLTQASELRSGYFLSKVITAIHLSFTPQSAVRVHESLKPESVSWLIADINKNPISTKAKIYPDNIDFINKIADYDKHKTPADEITSSEDDKIKQLEATKLAMGSDATFSAGLDTKIDEVKRSKLPIKYKDRSFHYLPYEFTASNFEKTILEHIFTLNAFQKNQLEVYFNGDRFLSTFKIKIYKKINDQWKLIQDQYTPDFVVIERKGKKVAKTLIIETKGSHLAHDFTDIRQFMEHTFVDLNAKAFDFLYLEDGKDLDYHRQAITDRINHYFSNTTT
ncbi:MAG: DEAD/DEAH box helicase family protein [Patescibacteria group bacterium]